MSKYLTDSPAVLNSGYGDKALPLCRSCLKQGGLICCDPSFHTKSFFIRKFVGKVFHNCDYANQCSIDGNECPIFNKGLALKILCVMAQFYHVHPENNKLQKNSKLKRKLFP